jgi:hypothetical protein
MGLGLYLAATPRVSNPLDVVEHHVRARHQDVLEALGRADGLLAVSLHPAAEDIEFAFDGRQLTVSAKTSTVGPGYHAYVCEMLRELAAELGATFGPLPGEDDGDETGYFSTGSRDALEDEMLAWLLGLAGVVAEGVAEGSSGFIISMSTDSSFEFDGAMATPLGPRSSDWLEAVQLDPHSGRDIFPWWSPGLGAEHAAGRALVRMWTEVRWRTPVDDDERELLDKVDRDLRRAHELDPTLLLPWPEWSAILGFLARDDGLAASIRERAAGMAPKIGYRRRPVCVTLTDGWSVRIPGEMASSFDDEGTWCGFMPGRTIWMSSFTVGDPESPTRSAAETLPTKKPSGTPVELPPFPEDYAQRASLGTTDAGDTMLTVEIARPHRFALFSFVLDDAADLDWARVVAAGIRG